MRPRGKRRSGRAAESRWASKNMPGYLATQVVDESHREVLGPLLPGSGASGVVVHRGWVIAQWGDPSVQEMVFSATRASCPWSPESRSTRGCWTCGPRLRRRSTFRCSRPHRAGGSPGRTCCSRCAWDGELWGKPTRVDAQSRPDGTDAGGGSPGSGSAYNDVRVNLLCLALTATLRQPLPVVLGERILGPLVASSWSWHGYANTVADIDGDQVPVVSGGAHWGGGLWMSANDLALLGKLYLCRGRWDGRSLLSEEWIQRSWEPCQVMADYGNLWWLNDARRISRPRQQADAAPRNGGRHLVWVDPDRDLVIASHRGDQVEKLLTEASAAVPATT